MTEKIYSISEIKTLIRPVAEKHGVERVFLFGSYSRGEQTKDSDIDLVIEKGNIDTLIKLSGFRLDLVDMLDKEVDVITTGSLKKDVVFENAIKKDEVLIYEKR